MKRKRSAVRMLAVLLSAVLAFTSLITGTAIADDNVPGVSENEIIEDVSEPLVPEEEPETEPGENCGSDAEEAAGAENIYEEAEDADQGTASEEEAVSENAAGSSETSDGNASDVIDIWDEDVVTVDDSRYPDNDELLEGFIDEKFEEEAEENGIELSEEASEEENVSSMRLFAAIPRSVFLSENERKMYELAVPQIKKIAAGEETSTILTLTDSYTFTAEDLGISKIEATVSGDKVTPSDEVKTAFRNKIGRLMDALLADEPYDLFWYDKTLGSSYSYSCTVDENGQWITYKTLILKMKVTEECSETGAGGTLATKKETILAINSTPARAMSVVNTAASSSFSDYDKLVYYRDWICKEVSYNYEAVRSSSTPYGGPWQLIWAFDGDPETKVVCEGYSKAFKWLCDLSAFDSDTIGCYLMTGKLGTSGHMWNNVLMDDNLHYLVDITNYDINPSRTSLFLGGYTSKKSSSSYYYDGSLYSYAQDTIDVFSAEELEMSATAYVPHVFNWGDLDSRVIKDMGFKTPGDVPAGLWVYGFEREKAYTGSPVTQTDMRVFLHTKELAFGTDYSVKYTPNTNAGRVTMTITGIGNYESTRTDTFDILPLSLSSNALSAPDITLDYTGKVQKGTTSVTYNTGGRTIVLKKGTDFEYIYDAASAYMGYSDRDAEYTVRIQGKGNYKDEASFKETILAPDTSLISASKFAISGVSSKNLSYDKEGNIIPASQNPVVKYKGAILTENKDYTVGYLNNDSIGTATLLINGMGGFAGTRQVSFKINTLPMSKVSITGISSSFDYTGSAISQNGYSLNGGALVEGRDYTVSYSNNINAGKNKAAITFTGKGIYSGSRKKKFSINAIPLNTEDFSIDFDDSVPYTKGGAKPAPEIEYNGETLVSGKDYSLKYKNNTAVNDGSDENKVPYVVITGKGNYSGSLTEYFTIDPADISEATMTATDILYKNKPNNCKPKIKIYDTNGALLTAGRDYERNIRYEYANGKEVTSDDYIPAGTEITAIATGKGYYAESEVSTEFRCVQYDISKIKKATILNKVYTGEEIELTSSDFISVLYGSGSDERSLEYGSDYEIVPGSYVDNIKTGTAKVTIRGINSFGGTRTVSFKIKKIII